MKLQTLCMLKNTAC